MLGAGFVSSSATTAHLTLRLDLFSGKILPQIFLQIRKIKWKRGGEIFKADGIAVLSGKKKKSSIVYCRNLCHTANATRTSGGGHAWHLNISTSLCVLLRFSLVFHVESTSRRVLDRPLSAAATSDNYLIARNATCTDRHVAKYPNIGRDKLYARPHLNE